MGNARPSKFCPPLERMSPDQLVLFKTVTRRTVEQDKELLAKKEEIQQNIAAAIADACTVEDFLRCLCEVRKDLACLPMAPARVPAGLTPRTLILQSGKDLCRESLVINGEEYSEHCMSDVERGASKLKQKLLLEIFEKDFQPMSRAAAHRGQSIQAFHEHKRTCVDRIIRAACRTISGGDSYDEIMNMFQSEHFLITPAKGLDKEEQKKKLTEISTHSVSAMVTTQSSFDIRFMDEDGSPLEEQYLQVDVTIVEFCDFRTVDELKHQKEKEWQDRRVMAIRMPSVEMYGDILDLM